MQDTQEQDIYLDIVETHNHLQRSKADLESLLNTTDSLEALVHHLDEHDVVEDGHKHGLMLSMESIAAAHGLVGSEILPELESHQSGTVSTEHLKSSLANLWKRLVGIIVSILNTIRGFWKKLFSYIGYLRMRAQALAKKASAKRHSSSSSTLTLGVEARVFVVGGKVITDPDSLVRYIANALDQYKAVTILYGSKMLEVGKQFERVLTSNQQGKDALVDSCKAFDKMPVGEIASKVKAMVYKDPRFGKRLVLAAPPTIGGWSLYFLMVEDAMKDKLESDPLAYAAALRTTGIKFSLTDISASQVTNATVTRAGGMQVRALANTVLDVLDVVENRGSTFPIGRLEDSVKAIVRASERYVGKTSGDTFDASVLRFARNYASWAMGPVDQMTSNLISVSRNLLIYGNKSLSF